MNEFRTGFARVNIDPPLGIPVAGYFVPRFATTILDSIYANAFAVSMGDKLLLLVSIDNVGIKAKQCAEIRAYIEEKAGVKKENIFLHCTHTHTGPCAAPTTDFANDCDEVIHQYAAFLKERIADAAKMAVSDLKPSKMGFITGWAPERVAYIRRYKMKDGTTWTCPPINDPNIDHPIGTLDQRVNVLRFDREGGDTVVLFNYGLHADTLNLSEISPDWPGWTSRVFETAVPGTKVIFFNGAEGDVGSTHVNPSGGDMNDTLISFDNEMKSPGMARFVGRALAGTLLQVYDKVEYVDVDDIEIVSQIVKTPSNKPDPKDLPRAYEYKKLHDEGRDDLIPYTAMELTTVVAEALHMVKLEDAPEFFELPLTGVKLGPVVLCGIPGEPFTDIGRGIKKAEGWKCVLPVCLVNGSEGYFPMKDAFDEGGYEARSSNYKGGVAENIIAGGVKMLDSLR